jgi:hypothetical protein
LGEDAFRVTKPHSSGGSFCINVAPTPFAWFVTFHRLEGCCFWATPMVFLKNSIYRWMAIVGVASGNGVGSTGLAFNSNRLQQRDFGLAVLPPAARQISVG